MLIRPVPGNAYWRPLKGIEQKRTQIATLAIRVLGGVDEDSRSCTRVDSTGIRANTYMLHWGLPVCDRCIEGMISPLSLSKLGSSGTILLDKRFCAL